MTIEIRAPNGDTVRFPDGTPDETIVGVMRQNYGGPGGQQGGQQPPSGRSGLTWGQWARDLITGEHTTEFPDAPEFAAEMGRQDRGAGGRAHAMVRALSAITPDPQGQLDIIRRWVPDVEHRTDRHGNLMLRAPSVGVRDWAYLNRPGVSWRDAAELGTGLVASAPFIPLMGAGASIPARLATGALAGAASSVTQDVAATGMGSNQGIDPERALLAGAISAPLAPGVPSAIAQTVTRPFRRSGAGAASETAETAAGGVRVPPVTEAAPEPPTAPLGTVQPEAPPVASAPASEAPAPWALGRPTQVVTPDGSMTVTAVPEVVELSSLRLARGELQPRDRAGRSEYTIGARERASQLDPERLMPGRVSDSGAPIVLQDGTVLSGNGRVMSINEAYINPAFSGRAAAYRARLGTAAQGMDRPVLVMRVPQMGQQEAARFADMSNRSSVAAMSVTERAARDARALGDDALGLYQGGDFDAPQNAAFLRAFMDRAVTSAERASVSQNNRLTREGVDRMRGAVLHSAYGDSAVISRMLEATSDDMRAITSALVDAAPRMAQLRGDIRSGLVSQSMDPAATISEALRLIGDMRSRGLTAARYFAQQDAFKSVSPAAEAWVLALHNAELTRPWSRERMAAIIGAYADEARLHQTGGLFADDTTADHVLDAAVRKVAREWGEEAAEAAPTAAPRPPQGGQRPPGGEEAPPWQPGAPAAGGADDASQNAATASLGPRERIEGRGDAPVNAYLERVATEPRRIPKDPTRNELAGASTAEGVPVPNVVARGGMIRRLAGGLRDTFVGAPLAKASKESAEAIGARIQAVAGEFSDLSSRSAGEVARKALAEWIETGGQGSQVVQGLYERVARLLKGKENTLNPLAQTRKVFNELLEEQARAASKVNEPALKRVREAMERPGLDFRGLSTLRTEIGHLIDGTIIPEAGTPLPALKQLYKALSEDLRTAAHRLGGDTAVTSLDKAIRVASMVSERRKALAAIVGKKGDAAPEEVMGAIVRLADGKAGRGDAAALLRARRVMGEDWDAVAGAAVRQLGQDGDTFSVRRFLTRYTGLSPNGRQILFRSSGKDSLADSLDNLAVLSTRIDDLVRQGNPSGTGNVAAIATTISAGFASPLHALGGVAGGYLLARMLARPLTAKATTRWVRAALENATTGSRATQASLAIATQMLARSMSSEGLGTESDLQRQLDAALGGGARVIR